MSLTLGLERY